MFTIKEVRTNDDHKLTSVYSAPSYTLTEGLDYSVMITLPSGTIIISNELNPFKIYIENEAGKTIYAYKYKAKAIHDGRGPG